MARPIKEGLDYFPLDVDMDQDDKIALIEASHGLVGFGIVVKILMKIYSNGYFYEWGEKEQLLFSRRINVDINLINDVINDCLKWGLFSEELYKKHGILSSAGIQRRYLEACIRRKQVKIMADYLLLDQKEVNSYKNLVIVGNNSKNVDIKTQSKVKESKVKKSKVNDPTTTTKENPVQLFERLLCRLSPMQMEKLYQWIDDFDGQEEIINEAIKIADDKNKRYFGFVEFLLKEWANNNLTTLDRIRAYEQEKFKKEGNYGEKIPQSRGNFGRPGTKTAEQALREAEEARKAWGG